jgi:pyruvate ferredoxin oxidoreductase gamma subunit
MGKTIEIRWHGRGGMGAKMAALLLGEALIHEGKYVQAFPEYGPERRGAPVTSFTRISDEKIKGHYGIRKPDIIVILDPTLLNSDKVRSGISEKTKLLINTPLSKEEIKQKIEVDCPVNVVDASKISRDIIGRDLPNTPMLGALIRVIPLLPFERFLKSIEDRLKMKFKKDVVEKNLRAIKKAYEEVK